MYREFYENGRVPSYAAVSTIFNLPFCYENMEELDYAIVGFPFEGGSVGRAETRYAPAVIRNHTSFKGELGYTDILKVDGTKLLKGTDLGEAPISFGYKKPSLQVIYETSKRIAESDTALIGLGGGQLVTLGELRGLKEVYGPVSLVHFDAEREVVDYEELYDDSTVIRRAVEEGLIAPSSSVQLGIRGGYNTKQECTYGKDMGITVLTASAMHEMSENEIIDRVKGIVGNSPCFISLNMNFLDPAYAPGVETPVVGGFSTHYLCKILRSLSCDVRSVGFDLVGLSSAYDAGQLAAQAAGAIVKDYLFGLAKKKQDLAME